MRDLSRRPSVTGSRQGKVKRAHSHSPGNSRSTGFSSKLPKVLSVTRTDSNLSRFCHRFQSKDTEPPTRESVSFEATGEDNVETEASVCSCFGTANREDVGMRIGTFSLSI